MKKNIILYILMLMCASGAWAQQTFVSAVKISAEESGSDNKKRLRDDNFIVIDQDLNAHEGGRDIYIGYKTTTNPAEAITGLLIVESSSRVDVRLSQYKTTPIQYRGKNYYRCDSYGSDYVDCDLNRKSGGADITLYYTKDGNIDDGGTPFTELTAVGENKTMAGYSYVRHWKYGTDMYSTAENDVFGNTNEGNGTYKIYLPYKYHQHSYTVTFNWTDNGKSCSVTTLCACGHSSTGNASITSVVKVPATYRVDGITTYTAKIILNNKEFTDTKDVQDIVMPLDEVKSVVKSLIDQMVVNERRADMSAFGDEKKALVDAATTRDEVLAIYDAIPADLEAAIALAIAQAKNDAKGAIQAALQGVTDEAILLVGSTAITGIDKASTIDMVNYIKTNALSEIQRLKTLAVDKADAVATIEALVDNTEDALAISEGNRYIELIRAARTADEVNALLDKAKDSIGILLEDDTAVTFAFTGSDMPAETQHLLNGVNITYSDDGEEMTVIINGAEVTYPLAQVSELAYFRGTPTVSLHGNEDPDNKGKYYTTFYSGLEAYTLPEGVKAYTAEISENTVLLTPIEEEILPQGEAVLLYTTEGSEITMVVADGTGVDKSENNKFSGVDVETEQYSSNYMLSYGQDGLAFYKMNPAMKLSANKAFLPASDPAMANVRAFRMVFEDEETGIETPLPTSPEGEEQVTIYNLQGIRLNKLQKGINIVNGKKIIVK